MPKFGFSRFNDETKTQFLSSPMKYLYHKNKIHCLVAGDIVPLFNDSDRTIFGFAVLQSFEDGKIYREKHLLDTDVYTGDAVKYNKYEIKADIFIIPAITIARIKELINLPATTADPFRFCQRNWNPLKFADDARAAENAFKLWAFEKIHEIKYQV